jgi:hypothetical protein
VARRSPERDFRLEEVVDAEVRHNHHRGGAREAWIVWGWWGIAAEGVDGGSSSTRRCLRLQR